MSALPSVPAHRTFCQPGEGANRSSVRTGLPVRAENSVISSPAGCHGWMTVLVTILPPSRVRRVFRKLKSAVPPVFGKVRMLLAEFALLPGALVSSSLTCVVSSSFPPHCWNSSVFPSAAQEKTWP